MKEKIAFYHHPLLDRDLPVWYVSGVSFDDMLFQIEGEKEQLSLAELLDLDESLLLWDNIIIRDRLKSLDLRPKVNKESGLHSNYDIPPIEVEEEEKEENPRRVFWLSLVAFLLITLVIFFSGLLFWQTFRDKITPEENKVEQVPTSVVTHEIRTAEDFRNLNTDTMDINSIDENLDNHGEPQILKFAGKQYYIGEFKNISGGILQNIRLNVMVNGKPIVTDISLDTLLPEDTLCYKIPVTKLEDNVVFNDIDYDLISETDIEYANIIQNSRYVALENTPTNPTYSSQNEFVFKDIEYEELYVIFKIYNTSDQLEFWSAQSFNSSSENIFIESGKIHLRVGSFPGFPSNGTSSIEAQIYAY